MASATGLTALPAGTRVGQYEIAAVLGQGGFGITYRAIHTQLGLEVAIKEYLPTSFAMRRPDLTVLPHSTQLAEDFRWGRTRFLEEAKTLARLEDVGGIVNVRDFLEANGTAYMVMALVRGETLEARLRREGHLPPAAIERIIPPLLDGLECVHEAGFLHRDIKPANILVDDKGRPTLIDFGASRAALQGRTQTLTAVYTPGYAAFEQSTSAKQGPYTDIYSLGATLYHCITGAPPPSASDRMRDDTLVPATTAGKGRYPPGLLAMIDATLKLREAQRPQSIAEWRRMMSMVAASDEATRATPMRTQAEHAGDGGSPQRSQTRGRWPVWLAAAVLVPCLLGAGWYVLQTVREQARIAAVEDEAWAHAVATNSVASYQTYVGAYSSGRYVAEAERRIAALKRAQEEAAQRAEAEAWARATAVNSVTAYQAYIAAYPSGRYVAEARQRAEAAARPQARDCDHCPEMVPMRPGSFTMGSPTDEPDRFADEGPQHHVAIGYALSLGKYEVTRGEFAAFVQATGHRAAGDWRNPGFGQTDGDPVVSVSWHDAQRYVEWLKQTTGKNYRLPSEAEWEYGARAGTTTVRYWGDGHAQACTYANVDDATFGCSDGFRNTAPVGRFPPNAFGLHDMLGNVREWTGDCWNGTYAGAPADGSAWLAGDCLMRVTRGGSWYTSPRYARAASRSGFTPTYTYAHIGFRVARVD